MPAVHIGIHVACFMLPYVLAVVGAAVAAAVVNLGKALVQQCSLQYGTNGTAVQQVQTCGSDLHTRIVLWCSVVKGLEAMNKLGHSAYVPCCCLFP